MEKKIKLVIVLAQEIKHIVGSCWGKQRCISPAERNHVGIVRRSGKEPAAHLAHHQHHTGHRWGNYFDSMSLSQNLGCGHKV